MKQKIVLTAILICTFCVQGYSQELPKNIRERLEYLKTNIRLKLDSCRTNISTGYLHPGFLSGNGNVTTGAMTHYEGIAYYAQYNLNWKMVYDDEMIARMIQLLNNEYRQDELDTLVNREMAWYTHSWFEQDAMRIMQVDTSKVFLQIQDSLNQHRDREIHPGLYQDFDVFQYLGLDTTAHFHFLIDSLKVAQREEKINYYLTNYVYLPIMDIVRQCGFIKDERLIEPLINLYNKLKENNIGDEKNYRSLIAQAKWSLFMMRVEPYYSEVLNTLLYSLDEIRAMDFVGPVYALAEILNNQDSFRELSKYMFSNAPTGVSSEFGFQGNAYLNAFEYIKRFIENDDLQKMITAENFNIHIEENRQRVYDWMQANYGKYEIRRIW